MGGAKERQDDILARYKVGRAICIISMQKSAIDSEDIIADSLKRINLDILFKEWLLMLSLAGNETRHVVTPNSPDITELFSMK